MKERIIPNQKANKDLLNTIPMEQDKDGIYKVKKHNFGSIDFEKLNRTKK